jgi:hypothetical protein
MSTRARISGGAVSTTACPPARTAAAREAFGYLAEQPGHRCRPVADAGWRPLDQYRDLDPAARRCVDLERGRHDLRAQHRGCQPAGRGGIRHARPHHGGNATIAGVTL